MNSIDPRKMKCIGVKKELVREMNIKTPIATAKTIKIVNRNSRDDSDILPL